MPSSIQTSPPAMHRRSLHPNRIYPAINGLDPFERNKRAELSRTNGIRIAPPVLLGWGRVCQLPIHFVLLGFAFTKNGALLGVRNQVLSVRYNTYEEIPTYEARQAKGRRRVRRN